MVAAVVLAAGKSSRMGSPKALLAAPDGLPFVVRVVRGFRDAGVERVVVVTGDAHAAIQETLLANRALVDPVVVRNPDPSRGQLSSLWVGMDAAIHQNTLALLVMLVDVPMATERTISAVIEGWRQSGAPIVRPAMGNRHGHPVLFDRRLFPELRAAPLEAGAKTVVRRYEQQILNVPAPEPESLVDIDTPEDYQALLR